MRADVPLITLKRGAVLAALAAVPASMALFLRWLSHRLGRQEAYYAGFIIYWMAGCRGFPMVSSALAERATADTGPSTIG